MKNQNIRIIIALVAGIIIALLGIWLWAGRTPSTVKDTSSTNNLVDNDSTASSTLTEGQSSISGNNPAIVIDDQNPGRVAVVSEVAMTVPGWVVIRDNNSGVAGNILGARLFDKGKNSGIVELLRPMVAGKSYFAEIYKDDGDIHSFDIKKDVPLKDANGKEIATKFSATIATDKQQ